jgi:hypothetical protein
VKNFSMAKKAFDRGYSVNSNGTILGINGMPLVSRQQNSGYLLVHVCTPIRYAFLVHQLVWVFHKGYPPVQINHIDGNKLNNRIENLEESNCSHNISHAYRTGLRTPNHGAKSGRSNLTDSIVLDMRKMFDKGALIKEVSERFRVPRSTVSYIVNRRTWTHI